MPLEEEQIASGIESVPGKSFTQLKRDQWLMSTSLKEQQMNPITHDWFVVGNRNWNTRSDRTQKVLSTYRRKETLSSDSSKTGFAYTHSLVCLSNVSRVCLISIKQNLFVLPRLLLALRWWALRTHTILTKSKKNKNSILSKARKLKKLILLWIRVN